MRRSGVLRGALLPGAASGLAGGLLFGAAWFHLGELAAVASLLSVDSELLGFALHLAIAALLGAGFEVAVWHQRPSAGGIFFWGLTYGVFWWFLGPLTLMPLWLGRRLAWEVTAAQAAFPSFLGHLVFGAGTGLALVALHPEHRARWAQVDAGVLARGALAGVAGGFLLESLLRTQEMTPALLGFLGLAPAGLPSVLLGGLAGLGFAFLYPRPTVTAGAALVRGAAYGFFWWVLGCQTLLPLAEEGRLAWSVEAARAGFPALPAHLHFGAALALLYHWLHRTVRLLFSDDVRDRDPRGIGPAGLRAVGRGAVSGLFGGLLFTVVMLQVGILPAVAGLVGSRSAWTGFFVHLLIANVVGATYGLLFRGQSYDVGSALGWGVSYGLYWWFLGALTLMPWLLGGTPDWSVATAAGLIPSLVGHLAYGAAVGLTFHRFEARYSPWWIAHRASEAERVEQRKQLVVTSAPAVWTLLVLLAITLPVLLSR